MPSETMEGLPEKKFRATLTRTANVAQGVKRFTFHVEGDFVFGAMQYAWIEIPNIALQDGRGNRRAFTLVRGQEENTFDILARISDSSFKQSLFALAVGDRVFVHGPFGGEYDIVPGHHPERIIMVLGGTAITCMFGIVEEIAASKTNIPLHVVYLSRSKEVTPCLAEIAQLQKKCPFLKVTVSYKEFVWSDVAENVEKENEIREWWAVGSQAMVDHVYRVLESGGVSRPRMRFSQFYPSPARTIAQEEINALKKQGNVFVAALEFSTNHTVITDLNGFVLYANRAAQEITGYSFEEMRNNTPRLWGGMMGQEFYRDFWEKKMSGKPFTAEITNRKKSGELYYAIAHISPVFSDDKALVGFVGTEIDVTKEKLRERALKENEARLRFALEGSRAALWDWDLRSDQIFLSADYQKMLGAKGMATTIPSRDWLSHIDPDDRAAVETACADLREGRIDYLDVRYRLVQEDGSTMWIQTRGNVTERSASGKGTRAIGIHSDVTKTAEREHEMEEMNAVMVDRELKMVELKKELKKLKAAKGV